jgi:hypothetical protein
MLIILTVSQCPIIYLSTMNGPQSSYLNAVLDHILITILADIHSYMQDQFNEKEDLKMPKTRP